MGAGALRVLVGVLVLDGEGFTVRTADLNHRGLADAVNARRRVAELLAAGLLMRVITGYRRARCLVLTPTGRALAHEVTRKMEQAARALTH